VTGLQSRLPEGYVRERVGGAEVVAQAAVMDAMRSALAGGTLYDFAARHPDRRELRGRASAYVVPLPGTSRRVVVRHSRHGGLLAGITGDVFLGRTRAPRELAVALRLADAGVPTPAVAGYVRYPVLPGASRADVATFALDGEDLAARLGSADPSAATEAWATTRLLLGQMTAAGARHPDLNLKNVFIVRGGGGGGSLVAYVLDVDRIVFESRGSPAVARANARRLLRSAQKWRDQRGLRIADDALAALGAAG
jgi:lipopolysaccharide kinase (Kdo/WaaP) family protein